VKNNRRRTVEGLDARQVDLPTHVLSVNLAEVGNEEGILSASLAHIGIDAFDVSLKGVADHALSQGPGGRIGLAEAALLGRQLRGYGGGAQSDWSHVCRAAGFDSGEG